MNLGGFATFATFAFAFAFATANAQTLAQKNWAGSGVSSESWWHRGVIYRIDPDRFQDGTGTGRGNLAGIAQRLEYIQSLGVDAILIAPAPGAPAFTPDTAGPGFDDLARGAADRHLRLLIELPPPASQAPAADAQFLGLARYWMNQGVAGLSLPTQAMAKVDGGEHIAALLRQLHALASSFPGDRILVAEAPASADTAVAQALAQNIQLLEAPPISAATPTALSLRVQLAAATAQPSPQGALPLLAAARIPVQPTPQQQDALNRTIAAMLLASRGAVLIDYGAELGLAAADAAPLMQWTPSNLTAPPPPPPAASAIAPGPADTAFKPYIPPLPRDLFRPPPMPEIFPTDHPINPLRDPNALPGFTAAPALPQPAAVNAAAANVALEDTDPASLLSFYRRLIQMHHDNMALRNGLQTLQDRDAANALLWTRDAPANARTSAEVVVVCNLAAKSLTLPTTALHMSRHPANQYTAAERTLLGTPLAREGEEIIVPAYSVWVGEAGR